jgi:hypothetical protein
MQQGRRAASTGKDLTRIYMEAVKPPSTVMISPLT